KRSFSAEQVADYRTCVVMGYTPAQCGNDNNNDNVSDGPVSQDVIYQVDTYRSGNIDLESESSRQYSIGAAWDATSLLNLTVDWYRIEIDNRIRLIEFQELVDFDNAGAALPTGTSVRRRANGSIAEVNSAYANEGDLKTSGLDM